MGYIYIRQALLVMGFVGVLYFIFSKRGWGPFQLEKKMFLSSCIIFTLVSSISQIEGRSTTEEGDVCIVGAGIGGAAVAYFSNSRKSKVFEARDYVGGRLKHIELDGVTIELGGDAWSSANEYIEKIVKDLGINTTLGMKKKFGDQ